MFDCILTQLDPIVKKSPEANIDKLKAIRFNRTTFVANGTILLNFTESIKKVDVS
jgi:hypothetical protein